MSDRLPKLWLSHYVYGGPRAMYLVVRDPHAGRSHVYTVHRIALTGRKASRVIGRELPLPLARQVVEKDMVR